MYVIPEESDFRRCNPYIVRISDGVLESVWWFVKCAVRRSLFTFPPIAKTRLYNFDPLKPHFYIVKLGFTGVYIIFLIFAQKHRLWVLVRTASLSTIYVLSRNAKNIRDFYLKIFSFWE